MQDSLNDLDSADSKNMLNLVYRADALPIDVAKWQEVLENIRRKVDEFYFF